MVTDNQVRIPMELMNKEKTLKTPAANHHSYKDFAASLSTSHVTLSRIGQRA